MPGVQKPHWKAAVVDEGLLERGQLPVPGEALDRQDRAAVGIDGKVRAGAHGQPVDEDRAGAADLDVARDLQAGQAEPFPEDLGERLAGFDADGPRAPVDGHREVERLSAARLRHGRRPPRAAAARGPAQQHAGQVALVVGSEPSRSRSRRARPGAAAPAATASASEAASPPGRRRARAAAAGTRTGTSVIEPTATSAALMRIPGDADPDGDRDGRPLAELGLLVGPALAGRPAGTMTETRISSGLPGGRRSGPTTKASIGSHRVPAGPRGATRASQASRNVAGSRVRLGEAEVAADRALVADPDVRDVRLERRRGRAARAARSGCARSRGGSSGPPIDERAVAVDRRCPAARAGPSGR